MEPLHASLGGSLFLRSVQPADEGVYMCVANSSAGTVSQEVTVRVVPELSAHIVPASLHVDSGSPAEFLCVTTAEHVSSPRDSPSSLTLIVAQIFSALYGTKWTITTFTNYKSECLHFVTKAAWHVFVKFTTFF